MHFTICRENFFKKEVVMKFDTKSLLLYAVTDRAWTQNESLYSQVEKALKGGVTFLQIREKNLPKQEFKTEAEELKTLAEKYSVPFVVNDDVLLAKEIDADGVHIGQDDMTASEARKILGSDKIIGVSVQTVSQALLAEKQGADYLGVGAVFPTGSKLDAVEVPHEVLREICESVRIPVVAIGGITQENVNLLSDSKISGIAVISAIFAQADIQNAARNLFFKTKLALNL